MHTIDLQFGNPASSFTINWGIAVPGLAALIGDYPDPTHYDFLQVSASGRPSDFRTEWEQDWWPTPTNEEELGHIFPAVERQSDNVARNLERFRTRGDLKEFILSVCSRRKKLIKPINDTMCVKVLASLAVFDRWPDAQEYVDRLAGIEEEFGRGKVQPNDIAPRLRELMKAW